MKTHFLKAWPQPFADVVSGKKRAEVRFNDRDYCVGDFMCLSEFDPVENAYTGSPDALLCITHIQTGFGLPDGLVVMSFDRMR